MSKTQSDDESQKSFSTDFSSTSKAEGENLIETGHSVFTNLYTVPKETENSQGVLLLLHSLLLQKHDFVALHQQKAELLGRTLSCIGIHEETIL